MVVVDEELPSTAVLVLAATYKRGISGREVVDDILCTLTVLLVI